MNTKDDGWRRKGIIDNMKPTCPNIEDKKVTIEELNELYDELFMPKHLLEQKKRYLKLLTSVAKRITEDQETNQAGKPTCFSGWVVH
jgi:hypothetical protein